MSISYHSYVSSHSVDQSFNIVDWNVGNDIITENWDSLCVLAQGFQQPQQQVVVLELDPPPDNRECFALIDEWDLGYFKDKFKNNIFIYNFLFNLISILNHICTNSYKRVNRYIDIDIETLTLMNNSDIEQLLYELQSRVKFRSKLMKWRMEYVSLIVL